MVGINAKMGPAFLVLFALLIGNSCSSEVEANEESTVNLIDLDEKALYLIISELNFVDTLNIARVHPILSEVANQVFRDKKPSYHLKISGRSVFSRRMRDFDYPLSGPIRVNNITLALDILQHFGSSIGKITVNFRYIKKANRIIVSKYLHQYVSKTVKQLELRPINQKILNEFKAPFKEVEDFKFAYDSERTGSTKRWNKLFPKVQRLSVSVYNKSRFSLVDCEFQHLKHLVLRVDKDAWNTTDNLEDLIKNNPNINNFDIGSYYTPEFMIAVNQYLPNLEDLTIHSWNIGRDPIEFANVKNFIAITSNAKTIDKLLLPKLDTLELHYYPDHREKWVKFFDGHTHLKRLKMVESFITHMLPINDFAKNLENLVDATLQYTTPIPVEDIITFLDGHEKLEKFRFAHQIISATFDSDANTLRERYKNDFVIKDFGYYGNRGLIFQKNYIPE